MVFVPTCGVVVEVTTMEAPLLVHAHSVGVPDGLGVDRHRLQVGRRHGRVRDEDDRELEIRAGSTLGSDGVDGRRARQRDDRAEPCRAR